MAGNKLLSALTELEHFRAKWVPVRVKKTRQNKKIEPRSDSIGTERALLDPLDAAGWRQSDRAVGPKISLQRIDVIHAELRCLAILQDSKAVAAE
jgi:hypothetical protein